MLADIQQSLGKHWISGFKHLRIADTSENEDGVLIYAFDFEGRQYETKDEFMNRYSQMVNRLGKHFNIVGSCLEFENIPFAVVEFRCK